MRYLLLLIAELLLVFNLLSQIEILLVLNTAFLSQPLQISCSNINLSFVVSDLFDQSDLFFFSLHVLVFALIKLSNKSIYFLSVHANLVQTVMLESVLFNLSLLVLLCEVSELVSQCAIISLSIFEFIDL